MKLKELLKVMISCANVVIMYDEAVIIDNVTAHELLRFNYDILDYDVVLTSAVCAYDVKANKNKITHYISVQ